MLPRIVVLRTPGRQEKKKILLRLRVCHFLAPAVHCRSSSEKVQVVSVQALAPNLVVYHVAATGLQGLMHARQWDGATVVILLQRLA